MIRNYIIISLLFLTSCDLLSTRDPEDPNTARSNFAPATSPEILFQNLKESFSEKIVENYMACFVDRSFLDIEYVFIPAAGSVSQFDELSEWTLDLEKQYFNNIKSLSEPDVPINLQLSNQISNPGAESGLYQFDYILTLTSNDILVPAQYEGSAQFKINLDSRQIWVITEWQDISKENFPSWSELKGRFY